MLIKTEWPGAGKAGKELHRHSTKQVGDLTTKNETFDQDLNLQAARMGGRHHVGNLLGPCLLGLSPHSQRSVSFETGQTHQGRAGVSLSVSLCLALTALAIGT